MQVLGVFVQDSAAQLGRSGRKGAFEFLSLTRKRNQTNQLQTKLLTSGPGSRKFASGVPDDFRAINSGCGLGSACSCRAILTRVASGM